MQKVSVLIIAAICCILLNVFSYAQLNLWTSAVELADKPMSGDAWNPVKQHADEDCSNPDVSNQDDQVNVRVLAAAIVYLRTNNNVYKDKVVNACEKLSNSGHPGGRTLAWARESGAYALAADLVGYRTSAFETWCRNMAEVWQASDNRTLLRMYKQRPNNWGTHAFGSICALYAYLQDSVRLKEIREYWIQAVNGPKPADLDFGSDKSWHPDLNDLRLINPRGAVKQGLNIDGIIPDDMRRNGSFSNPPPKPKSSYHWGALQGQVMAARIFERIGMPIWDVGDSALYRAAYALEVRFKDAFGGWGAEGDDEWILPFIDDAYGVKLSGNQSRLWDHGKNTGWPYVIWDGTTGIKDSKDVTYPESMKFYYNYPNPFNPSTIIKYSLVKSSHVKLQILDIRGRIVSELINDFQNAGLYEYIWEPVDFNKQPLSSGVYLGRIQVMNMVRTIKMILLY
jgi:hypothetical protein